jgi:hypothetical protein
MIRRSITITQRVTVRTCVPTIRARPLPPRPNGR